MANQVTLNKIQKGVLRRIFGATLLVKKGLSAATVHALKTRGMVQERQMGAGPYLELTTFGEAWAALDNALQRVKDNVEWARDAATEALEKNGGDCEAPEVMSARQTLSFYSGQRDGMWAALSFMVKEVN